MRFKFVRMRSITIVALLLSSALSLRAQLLEVGAFVGATGYHGDLSPVLITPHEVKPSVGALARINFIHFFSLRGAVNYGLLTGTDDNAVRPGLIERNLHFKSTILDVSLVGEINFFGYNAFFFKRKFTPYVFAGGSIFRFNPKAMYKGEWVELQPLGTEGQGTPEYPERPKYKLTQYSIPLGVGFKFAINENWGVDFQLTHHKTFTDYIDDVSKDYVDPDILVRNYGQISADLSNRTWEIYGTPRQYGPDRQRGNRHAMDAYMFGGFNVTYTFTDSKPKGEKCYYF